MTHLLAQSTTIADDPFGYGALGVLLIIAIRLIWWFIADLRSRADRYEQALQEERKAVLLLTETVHELKQLGVLMRAVLESLPQPDEPPRPPPRRRTS